MTVCVQNTDFFPLSLSSSVFCLGLYSFSSLIIPVINNPVIVIILAFVFSQIVTKHKNEARVLQELLRSTRTCRDKLARQLQATEDKLQHTKETLQQLQLLIQDQSLQEREELTLKLAKASAEVERKDKRILVWSREKDLGG